MEARFGHDFSRVRLHDGAAAAASARALGARAFTAGEDVVFGAGEYRPGDMDGRRLLAHELAHVVQQSGARTGANELPLAQRGDVSESEASQAAGIVAEGGTFQVASQTPVQIARTPLNIAEIRQDISDGVRTHPDLFSWLHVMGDRSGQVGFAAAPPQGTVFSPAPVPKDSSQPIMAHFFPSFQRHHERRALVLGGFHGNEQPGFQIGDDLVTRLQNRSLVADFHTLVVPRVNPGGIAANQRCNPQGVDLNRIYPTGRPRDAGGCPNTIQAPEQPESLAVQAVVRDFQPQRILSLHSIANPAEAGVFADPSANPAARTLACSMAGQLLDPLRQGNLRTTGSPCNPVYPGGATGGASFGAWAPTRSIPGQTVPVITLEAPRHGALGGPGRAVSDYRSAVDEFLR